MKGLIILLLVGALISGCSQCTTNLYTEDGKCCTYICDIDCPNGVKPRTCQCECNDVTTTTLNNDLNLDDLFDDTGDIAPPILP